MSSAPSTIKGCACPCNLIFNLVILSDSLLLLLSRFSCVRLCATLWTVARQAPPVHGILQAGILEWVAISSFMGSSRPASVVAPA